MAPAARGRVTCRRTRARESPREAAWSPRKACTRPAERRSLRALLRSGAVPAGPGFVDVGCGRGRALAVAALCGFGCLQATEPRPDLLADAERTLAPVAARAGGLDLRLRRADALEHELEPADQVFRLYDPFDQATTRAALGRILESWRENPRQIHVACHRNLLGGAGPGHEVFRGWRAETREFPGSRCAVFRSPGAVFGAQ